METTISWQGDASYLANSGSGHEILMDGPPDHGGTNQGPRPMEMLLMGLGGCSSFDVVHILKRSRQNVTGCEAQVKAERAETDPKVFTKIHLHFKVTGHDLKENRVSSAVQMSAEKYCSASIMLEKGGVEITHSYEMHEA